MMDVTQALLERARRDDRDEGLTELHWWLVSADGYGREHNSLAIAKTEAIAVAMTAIQLKHLGLFEGTDILIFEAIPIECPY